MDSSLPWIIDRRQKTPTQTSLSSYRRAGYSTIGMVGRSAAARQVSTGWHRKRKSRFIRRMPRPWESPMAIWWKCARGGGPGGRGVGGGAGGGKGEDSVG